MGMTDRLFGIFAEQAQKRARAGAKSAGLNAEAAAAEELARRKAMKGKTPAALRKAGMEEMTPQQRRDWRALVKQYPTHKRMFDHLTPEESKWVMAHKDKIPEMIKMYDWMPADKDILATMALGRGKLGWYEDIATDLVHVFGEDDAKRFARLLASTSAKKSVKDNVKLALEAWSYWKKMSPEDQMDPEKVRAMYRKLENSRVEGTDAPNMARALTGDLDAPLSGPKVTSFARNLQGQFWPITQDVKQAQGLAVRQEYFGGGLQTTKIGLELGDPGYSPTYMAANAKIRGAASEGGLNGMEGQETYWTAVDMARSQKDPRAALHEAKFDTKSVEDVADFSTYLRQPEVARYLRGYERQISELPERKFEVGDPTGGMTKADLKAAERGGVGNVADYGMRERIAAEQANLGTPVVPWHLRGDVRLPKVPPHLAAGPDDIYTGMPGARPATIQYEAALSPKYGPKYNPKTGQGTYGPKKSPDAWESGILDELEDPAGYNRLMRMSMSEQDRLGSTVPQNATYRPAFEPPPGYQRKPEPTIRIADWRNNPPEGPLPGGSSLEPPKFFAAEPPPLEKLEKNKGRAAPWNARTVETVEGVPFLDPKDAAGAQFATNMQAAMTGQDAVPYVVPVPDPEGPHRFIPRSQPPTEAQVAETMAARQAAHERANRKFYETGKVTRASPVPMSKNALGKNDYKFRQGLLSNMGPDGVIDTGQGTFHLGFDNSTYLPDDSFAGNASEALLGPRGYQAQNVGEYGGDLGGSFGYNDHWQKPGQNLITRDVIARYEKLPAITKKRIATELPGLAADVRRAMMDPKYDATMRDDHMRFLELLEQGGVDALKDALERGEKLIQNNWLPSWAGSTA